MTGWQYTALADLNPAADVGDTLASALNTALAANQSVKVNAGIADALDVDLHRVDLLAGDAVPQTLQAVALEEISKEIANQADLVEAKRLAAQTVAAMPGSVSTGPTGHAHAWPNWWINSTKPARPPSHSTCC